MLGAGVQWLADHAGARIYRHHLVPEAGERVLHLRPGAQGHRTLQRPASLQDRDPAWTHRSRRRRSSPERSRNGSDRHVREPGAGSPCPRLPRQRAWPGPAP